LKVLSILNTLQTPETPLDTPVPNEQVAELKARGVSVDVLHINRLNKLNYLKAAFRVLLLNFRPKTYDLVHGYYSYSGVIALLQVRYPVVITFLGTDLLGRSGFIGRFAARLAAGVIVMSEEMKRASTRPDAHVIPFEINKAVFYPSPQPEAREQLGLPPDANLILFPWDPKRPEKRYYLAEQALELLRSDFPDIQIVVIFKETHEVVAHYMNACDALVLTSDHEGSPVAIREALACGLPVVSVDVGDVRKVLEPVTGSYICRPEPEDIAAKLRRVLEDKQRATDGADQAQANVVSDAERVIGVYEEILAKK
jgi:teichuronic acid biosynthesis glycosyltransferase TuaC